MRVVVLGGTGWLGRHVCTDLAATGADVLAVARTAPPRWAHRFLAVDVAALPADDLARVLDVERPDAIVNATGGKWRVAEADMESNLVDPTLRLIAALERTACRPRLVHLGSMLETVQLPPGRPGGAVRPAAPTTVYARGKAAASQAVLRATAAGTVDGGVLRPANIAGPGAAPESLLGVVAGRLAAAAAHGETATVELKSLRAHRDYVDVRDVSAAVVAATQTPITGASIGIGRGEAVPVRSLVELLIEVSRVRTHLIELPVSATVSDGDEWATVDPRPARELLDWAPTRTLRDAVTDLWAEVSAATPRMAPR